MCIGLAPCSYVRVGARVLLQRRCRTYGVWSGGGWGDSSWGLGVCQCTGGGGALGINVYAGRGL
jgi:hypothetical protein